MGDRAYAVEFVKSGNRKLGELRTYPNGAKVYLASRKLGDIYRKTKGSISDSMREGVAGWAIDEAALAMLRARVVPFVGVVVRETGDIYLARTDSFYVRGPEKCWFVPTYAGRSDSLRRVLPLQQFLLRRGNLPMKRGA